MACCGGRFVCAWGAGCLPVGLPRAGRLLLMVLMVFIGSCKEIAKVGGSSGVLTLYMPMLGAATLYSAVTSSGCLVSLKGSCQRCCWISWQHACNS